MNNDHTPQPSDAQNAAWDRLWAIVFERIAEQKQTGASDDTDNKKADA